MHEIKTILDKIADIRVAVLGDFTLDFYITIDSDFCETSLETGLPVYAAEKFHTSPGGAGNVALNLKAIGVKSVHVFGAVGNDMFGYELLKNLGSYQIDISGIITQKEEWNTHVYTKVIRNGAEGNRIDFGTNNKCRKKTSDIILDTLEEKTESMDIVIINQQLRWGIHTPYFINRLNELIFKHPDTIFITDSRDFPESYKGTLRKINNEEALMVLERKGNLSKGIQNRDNDIVKYLYELWAKPVFLTRGENGILVKDKNGLKEIPGIYLTDTIDPVGAGDTTLSAISAALGAGYSSEEAAILGNIAASVTVQKLNKTGTASAEEILSQEKSVSYLYHSELAHHAEKASYWNNTEIEVILKPKKQWEFDFALFDHDGTISTLRQGWEKIMAPMMVHSILGGADVELHTYNQIQRRVDEYINKTTGLQTLKQMEGLVAMVKEYGFVDTSKILSKFGYKEIYNQQLMELVRKRTQKYQNGELNINDVTIKNSVKLLEILYTNGVQLFLASGTDQDDVIKEAEFLGYAHFFKGRIFGAAKNIINKPKKTVIENILKSIGKKNAYKIIAFGDGPVEIAETKKTGGYTVGVASNEVQRYDINLSKRTRLIKAGANCIIPDYSQIGDLLKFLGVKAK